MFLVKKGGAKCIYIINVCAVNSCFASKEHCKNKKILTNNKQKFMGFFILSRNVDTRAVVLFIKLLLNVMGTGNREQKLQNKLCSSLKQTFSLFNLSVVLFVTATEQVLSSTCKLFSDPTISWLVAIFSRLGIHKKIKLESQ